MNGKALDSARRIPPWLQFVLLLVAGAALRIPAIVQPWGADQAVYGYIGERILDGLIPYRDLYSSTGYGIFLTNALAMVLFGRTMLAAHLLDFVFYLATIAAVYGFCRSFLSHGTGILAGVLFVLLMNGTAYSYLYEGYSAYGTYWYLLQRENFQALLFLLAVWCMAYGERGGRVWWHLAAGVLIGLAVVYKFTAILFLGFGGLFILYSRLFGTERHSLSAETSSEKQESPARRRGFVRTASTVLVSWVLITGGVIVAHVPFYLWFKENDSVGVMIQAVFKHTKIYSKLSRGNVLENLFGGHAAIFGEQFALWVFALLAILLILRFCRSREMVLLTGWSVFSWLMVAIQKKFFGYHFILLSVPLAVLAALGIRGLLVQGSELKFPLDVSSGARAITWVLLVMNAFVFAGNTSKYFSHQLRFMLGGMDRSEYEEVFTAYPKHMYSVPADRSVAEWITAHKKEGDHLEIVNGGGENLVHFLSGTTPTSRFTSTWYVLIPELYDEPYTSKLRHEFVQNIMETRPAFVLFVYFDMPEYTDAGHKDIRDFVAFMKKEYVKVDHDFAEARYLYVPRDDSTSGS